MLGESDEAETLAEEALGLAEPGGIIWPFVELGQPMADLLERLKDKDIEGDFIKQILTAIDTAGTVSPDQSRSVRGEGGESPDDAILLTMREQEVLSLLAEGLTNQEIADKIFLSPETIKRHIYNIYQKLDVHSRVTAIAKAQSLGLLS